MDVARENPVGPARRRRDRRLRACWRHEQLSLRMLLTAGSPRRQCSEGESDEMNHAKGQKTPLPAELFSLFEEELEGTRVQRRTVEHIIDTFVSLPMLDSPVPLVAEQLVDVLPSCRRRSG